MFPSRLATALCASCIIAGVALPATVGAQSLSSRTAPSTPSGTIVDIVIQVSGSEGFDDNGADYDLLREALVATGLAAAVADTQDITVFAPTDAAFLALAIDLGFTGADEAGAFGYIAGLTGYVSAAEPGLLDDVLLYHVSPGAKTVRELRRQHPVSTLLADATFEVRGNRVIDGDANDRDGRIRRPLNLRATNGIIQTVDGVLRPIDLEPPAPPLPNIVETVLAVSGTEGFDDNGADYDLLRDALVATGLAGAVADTQDITVFAPTDAAFLALATDLGFTGTDEAGAFGYIAGLTGYVSAAEPGLLDDVLLYHVAPGTRTEAELNAAGPIATLLADATVEVSHSIVIDGDANDDDGTLVDPKDLAASNGIIHTVDRVLRPIDLEPPAPPTPATVVDVVIGASGSEGFDRNYFDYDVLREALVAAGLVDALATAEDVTVFAPNDFAFVVLAYDLGYRGFDEAEAFAFIAGATGYVSPAEPGLLDDVLLYHVLPGAKTVAELDGAGDQATLLTGATLSVKYRQIRDGDPNDVNGVIVHPNDVVAGNGIVHTTAFVLRPIDL
jgi:uncharacterized surface protein with fasciclin (FAS1) repeats